MPLGIDNPGQAPFLGIDGYSHLQYAVGQRVTQIAGTQGHDRQIGRPQMPLRAVIVVSFGQNLAPGVQNVHFRRTETGNQLLDILIDKRAVIGGDRIRQPAARRLQCRDGSLYQQIAGLPLRRKALERHQHECGREDQSPGQKRELHDQRAHYPRHRFADGCHVYPCSLPHNSGRDFAIKIRASWTGLPVLMEQIDTKHLNCG